MRLERQHGTSAGARAWRVALALLVLSLHAALAGASHFHRPGRGLNAQASSVAAAVRSGGAQAAPDSSVHAECLLCRLQRNLASGLRNAGTATTEPLVTAQRPEAVSRRARPGVPPGVAHGRAPPHA